MGELMKDILWERNIRLPVGFEKDTKASKTGAPLMAFIGIDEEPLSVAGGSI